MVCRTPAPDLTVVVAALVRLAKLLPPVRTEPPACRGDPTAVIKLVNRCASLCIWALSAQEPVSVAQAVAPGGPRAVATTPRSVWLAEVKAVRWASVAN